ncbi:MAG: hypothetical protein DI628_06220 [Blastochloris viridis]|uniref:C-type lysozyme inhibitor domain-containing protein n=1 Tax=Blastochloris viridis TaxID=1079 RepID=A0A6N4QYK0_BLAVI|nr:MAG: hypothetical protein DI628_06220 [Blastochloris viridis]
MKYALLTAPLLLMACATKQAEAPRPTHVYGCNGSVAKVEASYPDADTAIITIQTDDNRPTYTLKQVVAASGAKYSTSKSSNPTTGHFIWWTKGNNAVLFTTAKSTSQPEYVYEKQLATCMVAPYTGSAK